VKSVARAMAALTLAMILLSLCASAETITGTIKNGTTNKPAAGDQVILFSLRQGMEESGRAKTDAAGNFSFTIDEPGSPHLIRAIHQDVTYHSMVPPGTTRVEMSVYDTSQKVPDVSLVADVLRLQAQGSELRGVRLFSIDNNSKPPRSQIGGQNFDFQIPQNAQIDSTMGKTEGGQPVNVDLIPQNQRGRYAFDFPLRPGQTQFQVAFHLPYNGQAKLDLPVLYPAQHFVLMVPTSMKFVAEPGSGFQSMQDPKGSEAAVQVASNTQPGQSLTFTVSGYGNLPAEESGGSANAAAGMGQAAPGGTPMQPNGSSEPLPNFAWYVLGIAVLALLAGAVYIYGRPKSPGAPAAADVGGVHLPLQNSVAEEKSELLLHALKEEIFQLEVEHQQGRISDEEYANTKAALDHTLGSALKRRAQARREQSHSDAGPVRRG
jgi:hypothetical protein